MLTSHRNLAFPSHILALLLVVGLASDARAQRPNQSLQRDRNLDPSGFPWPHGAKMALSLTFDDGRSSQVIHAVPVLDSPGAKATFIRVTR